MQIELHAFKLIMGICERRRVREAFSRVGRVVLDLLGLLCIGVSLNSPALGEGRLFTPRDDIGITLFNYAGEGAPGGVVKYAPDGRHFVVLTERGALDSDAPEDVIWLFSVAAEHQYLRSPPETTPPAPTVLVRFADDRNGPLIQDVRWLQDSSGITFSVVEHSKCCMFHRLYLIDIKSRNVMPLTPKDEDVGDYDVRSSNSYVYTVKAPQLTSPPEDLRAAVDMTGHNLWSIVFAGDGVQKSPFPSAGLWAVTDGRRHLVLDAKDFSTSYGLTALSLSPDGRSAIAIIKTPEADVRAWSQYQAPLGYQKYGMPLDTAAYHLIDLETGKRTLLIDAPSGLNKDWDSGFLTARWSANGRLVLLPDTFLPLDVSDTSERIERKAHAYAAVLDFDTGKLSKVLSLRAGLDKRRFAVNDMRFEDDHTVVVNFDRSSFLPDESPTALFRQVAEGGWREVSGAEDPRLSKLPIEIRVRESMNEPPGLIARDKAGGASRLIWDPNPQLKGIELGSGEVIHWTDETGFKWEAGLIKPPNFSSAKRYPLVIQTHGFVKKQFLSSGIYTSAFAARSLAAAGIVVVQMGWNPTNMGTPKEGNDQLSGFRSLIEKLAGEGMVDPHRVGAIGFSRSVYHVLFTLSNDPSLLAAASVTDGVTFGYFEYLYAVDGFLSRDANHIIGGPPFTAEGLANWIKNSPEFHLSRAETPLLMVQPGPQAVLADWEPYAVLRYLKKPVDLIMLQPGTHVMTNPTQRLAAETANVDWFQFWLNGHEDPDPAKRAQYARWEKLCDLQIKQVGRANAVCVPLRAH